MWNDKNEGKGIEREQTGRYCILWFNNHAVIWVIITHITAWLDRLNYISSNYHVSPLLEVLQWALSGSRLRPPKVEISQHKIFNSVLATRTWKTKLWELKIKERGFTFAKKANPKRNLDQPSFASYAWCDLFSGAHLRFWRVEDPC